MSEDNILGVSLRNRLINERIKQLNVNKSIILPNQKETNAMVWTCYLLLVDNQIPVM